MSKPISTLNGYEIKDAKARNDIETNKTNIENLEGSINAEKNTRSASDTVLQNQINNLVLNAGNEESSSAEIVQARTNIRGGVWNTLNDRISFVEKNVPFRNEVLTSVNLNDILYPTQAICITPTNSPSWRFSSSR